MHAALAQRSSFAGREVGDANPRSVVLRRDQPRPLAFHERSSNRSPMACERSDASALRESYIIYKKLDAIGSSKAAVSSSHQDSCVPALCAFGVQVSGFEPWSYLR